MMNFDRSNKKRFLVNPRLFVTGHVLWLMLLSSSVILFSCTKSRVMPTPAVTTPLVSTNSVPAPKYIFTADPNITISNYKCLYNSNETSHFVGKLYGSKTGNYSFAGYDKLYVYAAHDSLYLTLGGISHLFSTRRLDINILATNDSITYSKAVTLIPDEFAKNQVIAHRGTFLAGGLPENSLAALKKSLQLGFQGSEFDVHLTVDKVLVVCHDDTYAGYTIEKATYAQLNQTKLANGEDLPLLRNFLLEFLKQRKTKTDLEIKPSIISKTRGLELGDSVLSLVHQLKAQAWVHYTSFDYDILKRIRTKDQGSQGAYLVYGTGDAPISKLLADGIGMDYNYNDLVTNKATGKLMDCVNAGVYVSVWTVDVQSQIQNILNICPKISGIVTDLPELTLTLVPKQ